MAKRVVPDPTSEELQWLRTRGDEANIVFTRPGDSRVYEGGQKLLDIRDEGYLPPAVLFRIDHDAESQLFIAARDDLSPRERYDAVDFLISGLLYSPSQLGWSAAEGLTYATGPKIARLRSPKHRSRAISVCCVEQFRAHCGKPHDDS